MLTADTARGEVERALPGLLQEFGSDVFDVTHVWSGNSMNFSFRARGLSFKGRIDVTDSQVVIEVSQGNAISATLSHKPHLTS